MISYRFYVTTILLAVPVFMVQYATASQYEKQTTGAICQQKAIIEPNGIIRLNDVLALSVIQNPELAAYSFEVRAQNSRAFQSKLLPNPELGVTVEEFGGSGATKGFDSAKTTVQVSQLIQLNDKRIKRHKAATLEKELADWDYQARKLDVLTGAAKSFIDVISIQERVSVLTELLRLSEQTKTTVSERVQAGKVSPLEQTKAEVSYAVTQISLETAIRELEIARTKLAAYWGSTTPQFEKVEGDLYTLLETKSYEELSSLVIRNPDLLRWSTEINQKRAARDFERSKATPDITISAGTQYFAEPGDSAFIVGLSIPLPFFDRNQGGIREASIRLNKAYALNNVADVQVKRELIEAYKLLVSTYQQALAFQTKVITGAQNAFDASREGYSQGKFGYLDVLDSQRTLFEVKQQYIDVLASYHKARADVNRLVGDEPVATQ